MRGPLPVHLNYVYVYTFPHLSLWSVGLHLRQSFLLHELCLVSPRMAGFTTSYFSIVFNHSFWLEIQSMQDHPTQSGNWQLHWQLHLGDFYSCPSPGLRFLSVWTWLELFLTENHAGYNFHESEKILTICHQGLKGPTRNLRSWMELGWK